MSDVAILVAQGVASLAAGQVAEAEARARAALAIQPDNADALHLAGVAAWRSGRAAEAAPLIERAVALAPRHAEARKNLGVVLFELGRLDEALVCFRETTMLQPGMAAAHYHLAMVLREKGDLDGAITVLRRVLSLEPENHEAAADLAAATKDRGRILEAIGEFRRIVAARPGDTLSWINLGRGLMDHGDSEGAREAFGRARALDPGSPAARFGTCLAELRVCYASETQIAESRSRYGAALREICDHYAAASPRECADAAPVAAQILPFYLAYQGQDDRELQSLFGGLLHRLHAARYPQWVEPLPVPPREADGRLRVAFVSGFFRDHSVWKLYRGWVSRLDRRRFRVLGFSTARRHDEETLRARRLFDSFVESAPSFEAMAAGIRAAAPHIIVYPEVGMDPTTARLAALRLAPVQYLAMGHPDTTGLPTLDYFLSGELMEAPGSEAFYSERLVRLPNLSFDYQPLELTPVAPDLRAAGVRPDAVTYLCCQSLYKYRPAHDDLLPRIAQSVPNAQFLFIAHSLSPEFTALTRQRLTAAFRAAGLDADRHVVFLPPMSTAHYAGLNAAADIYLDSLDWSGGNTTLEAVAAGLPIVTMPGRFLRGRVSHGIMRRMGLTDTVAHSTADYVSHAVRLGLDAAWRSEQAARVTASAVSLYGDSAPVEALQEHFCAALDAVTRR